ncbi:hypothetical protein PHMEG_00021425 [Phytophthora megakarya]|uniref:Peptidase A2 domain-containing protein n=1 Tax=Phytophthora megakarya TaxID=4795 RepID=A0A225VLM9_9STRA|nr:hypothetical protein PHMEG_00021425 [Phytophthora megakarya]
MHRENDSDKLRSQTGSTKREILLLDTGAEVSILDIPFARKVGCHFDTSQRQECVGIGDSDQDHVSVYCFDIWIEDLSGQNAILGMDLLVPAGVRMNLADGSMRLPDEVGIPLNGHKRLYGEKVLRIPVGRSEETAARIKLSVIEKLWVTRGERWVPTVTEGPGRIRYLEISNIGEEILRLDHCLDVGVILDQDKVPRSPGFMSVGFYRYREWQNLALESTNPQYNDQRIPHHDQYYAGQKPLASTEIAPIETPSRVETANAAQIEEDFPIRKRDIEDDDEIYYHESGDLSAEDLEGNLAMLPEIPISTTAKVSIEDLQVGDSGSATPEEIEKLRQIIWKKNTS